jgi:hypothetical protein
MNPEYLPIAAEYREEVAFWPLVTAAYLYAQTGSDLYILAIILTSAFGVPSFLVLKKLRGLVKDETGNKRYRKPADVPNEKIQDILDDLNENGVAGKEVTAVGLNVLSGGVLYLDLIGLVRASTSPNLIGVGLFAIPIVMVMVAIWSLIRLPS